MQISVKSGVMAVALASVLVAQAASAADTVRVIDSTRGPYGNFALYQARDEGYYKKENLDVSTIFGSGGSATLQAIITGSAEIAYGVGTESVIGAFAKGAPVVILANAAYGVGEIFWYTPVKNSIKTLQDLNGGKTLAFSQPGATTHLATQFLVKALNLTAKLQSTGNMASSRTMAMSGQTDSAWSSAPFNLELIRKGEARIIGRGTEAKELNGLSVRVIAANANWLKDNRDVAKRVMRAFWRGTMFNYVGGERAIKRYADQMKLDIQDARKAPEFVTFESVALAPIGNIPLLMKLAQEDKFIAKPLTDEQIHKMIDIVYDPLRDN